MTKVSPVLEVALPIVLIGTSTEAVLLTTPVESDLYFGKDADLSEKYKVKT